VRARQAVNKQQNDKNKNISEMTMKTKPHTPGPWNMITHATPEYAPQFGIYADGQQFDFGIIRGADAKANARLIAAAPDLLFIAKRIDELAESGDLPLLRGWQELGGLKSAIARAEGREA